jgi:hypothetical protein
VSATWRPVPPGQHLCGHRRCIVLYRVAAAVLVAALLSLAALLAFPSWATLAATAVLSLAGLTLSWWPCTGAEPADDLMAVADAVREDYCPSYVPPGWPGRYLP